jgi:hypothetical protein
VNWEIDATLSMGHGLIGVHLPTNPICPNGGTHKPDRLQDDIDSRYALFTTWHEIVQKGPHFVQELVALAKEKPKSLIKNDRPRRFKNGKSPDPVSPFGRANLVALQRVPGPGPEQELDIERQTVAFASRAVRSEVGRLDRRPVPANRAFLLRLRHVLGVPFHQVVAMNYNPKVDTLLLYWGLGSILVTGPKAEMFLERFSEHRITVVWLLTDRRERPYVDSPEALGINNLEKSGISGGGLIYNFSVWEGKNGNSRTIDRVVT